MPTFLSSTLTPVTDKKPLKDEAKGKDKVTSVASATLNQNTAASTPTTTTAIEVSSTAASVTASSNTAATTPATATASTQKALTVKSLVTDFSKAWNAIEFSPDLLPKIASNTSLLNQTFEMFVKRFGNTIDYTKNYGFIEKRDLPLSEIFVRADLHGDLKSLIENLLQLQQIGHLDANFKCKPNFHLIILGDYSDRGDYGLEILVLIAYLKMENPDQVILIRGNHESTKENKKYVDKNLQTYIASSENLLTKFYESMPLAVYVSMNTNLYERREYVLFTHGTFEPITDLSELIDIEAVSGTMVISKVETFSQRVTNLCTFVAPKTSKKRNEISEDYTRAIKAIEDAAFKLSYLPGSSEFNSATEAYKKIIVQQIEAFDKDSADVDSQIKALAEEIQKLGKSDKRKEVELLKLEREIKRIEYLRSRLGQINKTPLNALDRDQINLESSVIHIRKLVETQLMLEIEANVKDRANTYYNWGDVAYFEQVNARSVPIWDFTSHNIRHYFRICSAKHTVKLMFRGHQHAYRTYSSDRQTIAVTLPTGIDGARSFVKKFTEYDLAYVLKTAPKVSAWTQVPLVRYQYKSSEAPRAACPIGTDFQDIPSSNNHTYGDEAD